MTILTGWSETIYQALYRQARGGLRREVAGWLRTGRIARRPHIRPDQRRPRMSTPMVMISDRPPEVTDRAVPAWDQGSEMHPHAPWQRFPRAATSDDLRPGPPAGEVAEARGWLAICSAVA
ncbi:transposase, ISlxx5 [Amycolatopsis vancoresmycina DSM 44592]|uniref:Transposase, ISlxx5 n=1 Tax=Amycolatopsis vancoresmycina DSM 44592 TaxID=1292037 RepID=R1HHR9_9PSEU|nr:transposase, ISlxx5 [Amycolatopsis vancoresmycina DSM 44592]